MKDAIRGQLWELQQRIEQKDYAALFDAAKISGAAGVNFIWSYAHSNGADPQTRPKALEAIKHAAGFKEKFQARIASFTDRNLDPSNEVKILTAIGNREAAEVLAPYLFDYRIPGPENESTGIIYNRLAAQALGEMHFGDAPAPDVSTGYYGPEKLVAWQKWAISHGMVPKEWEARVGIPEWQYKLAAIEQNLFDSYPDNREQKPTEDSDVKRISPIKRGARAGSSEQERQGANSGSHPATTANAHSLTSGWLLCAEVAIVLAAVGGWMLFRSKRG